MKTPDAELSIALYPMEGLLLMAPPEPQLAAFARDKLKLEL